MECPWGIHMDHELGTLNGGSPEATQKPDDLSQLINGGITKFKRNIVSYGWDV